MNDFKESLKVNIESVTEKKSILLLKQYIAKEKELCKIFDEEDGIDVDAEDYKPEASVTIKRIMNLLEYRNIRVKQAYTSMIYSGDNSGTTRAMLADIDKSRREKHNLALTSLIGLVNFAKQYGMEPIYTGPLLSEQEIKEHKGTSQDVRMEMTDAFLKILMDLGEYSIAINNDSDLRAIQNKIFKVRKDYAIKSDLSYDDGDIKFEDAQSELYLC